MVLAFCYSIFYNNEVLHTNVRWTGIRFKELIATYGYRGDSRGLLEGLLESLIGI